MKCEMTPTDEIHFIDGVPTRKWEVVTEDGVRFRLFTNAVTCDPDDVPFLKGLGLVQTQFDIEPNPLR